MDPQPFDILEGGCAVCHTVWSCEEVRIACLRMKELRVPVLLLGLESF